jgi:serine/alanine adding enzyme
VGFEILERPHERPWREALRLRPDALLFQWPEMLELYEASRGLEPGALVAVEKSSGKGIACLAWETIEPKGRLRRWLLKRCVVRGGPVYEPGNELGRRAARALVARHAELMRRRAVYSQFRNAYIGTGIAEALQGLGRAEPQRNFMIDLSEGPEPVFSGMSSSRRKGIRRAERDGLTVRRVSSSDDIDRCYGLFTVTYRRAGLPLFDVSLFRAAARVLGDRVRFYLAQKDEEGLAARAMLLTGHSMYDWFAGSTQDGERSKANELIVWQALREACDLGLRVFDFGEAGNPEHPYGPREFKRRFGGRSVDYQRTAMQYAPIRCGLIAAGLKLRR